MKLKELLNEGTWALPFTKHDAMKLYNIMLNELTASEAKDTLYNIIGDDQLYDLLDDFTADIDKDAPFIDIRPEIATRLKHILDEYEANPKSFKHRFDDDALKILKTIVKSY